MAAAKTGWVAAIGTSILLVAAIVGGWFAFISAPPPEEVCAHIIDVTIAEAGEQGLASATQSRLVDRLRDRCIEHKKDKIHLRGRLVYARYARCIMAAETLRAIEDC